MIEAIMIKFTDEKKKKEISLPTSFLVNTYRALVSGATCAIMSPNVDWNEIKSVIGIRQQPKNLPLGVILTKPNSMSFFTETVWEDTSANGQHDGDITLFKEVIPDKFSFIRMKPEEIKKLYPAWYPYHHEDKSYLK